MEVTEVQYKESEIGVIPVDWEVKQLSTIGKFTKGQGIRKDEATNGEIPCVRYGELYTRHNDYIKEYFSFISNETAKSARRLRPGDILFAGSGETKEEIGKCAAFVDNIEAYAGGDIVILSPIDVSPLFLGYLLNAQHIQKQKASKGQGDAIVHISANQLGSIQIPLPPTKSEQTAIATALSDTDALIENLEKLIAKKRNIKQGVMQELLTGRKRLEGFDGNWELRKLGDLAEMYSGGTPPTTNDSFYNGDIPWVVIADMTKSGKYIYKTDKTITETGLQNSSAKLFKKGVILFAMYASIGKCTIAQMDTACNQAILGISTKLIDTEFLYYYLVYNESKFILMGQTGTQSNLNKEIVQELRIPLPQRNEQIEIAGILSNIDNEIDVLEQKLRKSQMIKQGMMQALLTGKIRLV